MDSFVYRDGELWAEEASIDKLAAEARPRLQVYVYRLTLNDDLAQDITQETMLEMFRILGKLKDTNDYKDSYPSFFK